MPMLIEHIDAIARKKQRDVLFLEFHPEDYFSIFSKKKVKYNYQVDKVRKKVIKNLDTLGVPWQPCGHIASTSMMCSYAGQIYLDVPYDESLPLYCALQDYLETPDGAVRLPTVRFFCLPLEMAMTNAHHDEPGFWEKWAEDF